MTAWLYQMTTTDEPWSPEIYRKEVWEGRAIRGWGTGTPRNRGITDAAPSVGDVVIFYFCKGELLTDDIGVYGWGIILKSNPKAQRIDLRVSSPSDYLKMSPLWNGDMQRMIDTIRGNFTQLTMWAISLKELQEIRTMVRRHIAAHI